MPNRDKLLGQYILSTQKRKLNNDTGNGILKEIIMNSIDHIKIFLERKDYDSIFDLIAFQYKDFRIIFNKDVVNEKDAYDMFRYFIKENLNLNIQDRYGKTFLMYACDYDYLGIVRTLCKNGIDITLKDKDGNTAYSIIKNKPFSSENDKIKTALEEYSKERNISLINHNFNVFSGKNKIKCVLYTDDFMVYFYDNYEPYHNGTNPYFNNFSSQVLNYKNKASISIDFVKNIFISTFKKDFSVVCVPSSKANNLSLLPDVLAKLPKEMNIEDCTNCLYRKYDIESSHNGGNRSINGHKKSIGLRNAHLIENKTVLLFDDIITTSVSMRACYSILKEAKPKEIICFCLGKTIFRQHMERLFC